MDMMDGIDMFACWYGVEYFVDTIRTVLTSTPLLPR